MSATRLSIARSVSRPGASPNWTKMEFPTLATRSPLRHNGPVRRSAKEEATRAQSGGSFHDQGHAQQRRERELDSLDRWARPQDSLGHPSWTREGATARAQGPSEQARPLRVLPGEACRGWRRWGGPYRPIVDHGAPPDIPWANLLHDARRNPELDAGPQEFGFHWRG